MLREGIRPEKLAFEIEKQLKEYTDEIKETVWDIAMDVSEDAVKRLKEESPKGSAEWEICQKLGAYYRPEWDHYSCWERRVSADPSSRKGACIEKRGKKSWEKSSISTY